VPLKVENPLVCYVTDRKTLGSADAMAGVRERICKAIEAGADWLQIREKDLPAKELLSLANDSVFVANSMRGPEMSTPARVIMNDRLDVALASRAAGVHLGKDSIPAAEAVRWCRSGYAPTEFLVGVSCHSLEEARRAEDSCADYVIFGPVFDTPSKRAFGPVQGIGRLTEVCRAVRIPVVAIGGVNPENAADCLRAGAAGIAAIRMFQEVGAGELHNTIANLHQWK
jgi:thiamine-phosphate pyrophosphorylase